MDYQQFVSSHPKRKVAQDHCLSMSGIDVLKGWFLQCLNSPMDLRHVDFVPTIENYTSSYGEVSVQALHLTNEGMTGLYQGDLTWTYEKISLAQQIPYPIRYSGSYPAQWGYMRRWLEETYGLVFDNGELMLLGSNEPLKDTDYLNAPIIGPDQYLKLVASVKSHRFIAQETSAPLRLVLTPKSQAKKSFTGFSWGNMETTMRELIPFPDYVPPPPNQN